MTGRRWFEGDYLTLPGVPEIHVERGVKHPEDLRLKWHTSEGWTAVPMCAGFVLADFFWENENVLYPRGRGLGGEMYLRQLAWAGRHGWEGAQAHLEADQRRKRGAA